jgi:hypothetical protein
MAKFIGYSKVFNPVYVLITGSLGVFITFAMFLYRYPDPLDQVGQAFASRPEFLVWVFLHATLSSIITITLIPIWGVLFRFFLDQIKSESSVRRCKLIFNLIINALIWITVLFILLRFLEDVFIRYFDPSPYIPGGYDDRVNFIYGYTTLAALPALLGIMTIHPAAQSLLRKIEVPDQTKNALFALRKDLFSYRTLLQGYLLILGIILSMISITTAGSRAIFVGLEVPGVENFPVTIAILYGLVFTVLLLLVYVPVHFTLTETSRKLRDRLCPIETIDTLEQDLVQRKHLDEVLQTNVSILDNLKYGFITLAPLVSSLLANVIGFDISP